MSKHHSFRPQLALLCALLCTLLLYACAWLLTERGVRFDLTPQSIGTLSQETQAVLEGLSEPVHFYLVYQKATDNTQRTTLETIADSYALTGHVVCETIDPIAEPGRLTAYTASGVSIAEGSVVVTDAAGQQFAIVPAREMYTYVLTTSGTYTRSGIAAEQKLTAAIREVTAGARSTVYFLTGHDEAGMESCTQLTRALEKKNYRVETLTLGRGEMLQPGDVVLILSPALDLTEEEDLLLQDFLSQGGRMLFACDATLDLTQTPRFAALSERVSLRLDSGLVVEDERSTGYWANSPLYLMPAIDRTTGAAAGMTDAMRVIVPGARPVSGPEMQLSGYTYETVLHSSELAYVKQTDSSAYVRMEGDPTGRQQLLVTVSHQPEQADAEQRLAFTGTLYTLMDNSLLSSTYNLQLSLSVIDWLAERPAAAEAPVRSWQDTSMPTLSTAEQYRVLAVILALPLLTAVTCAIVLIRRRKR